MKQDELLKTLIKELMKLTTLHQEYQDNDTHFVVDSQKKDNTLTIKVQILENKDKKEFENWLSNIDNDLFTEVLSELKEKDGLIDIENMYNSDRYQEVIDKVKAKTRQIVNRKIKQLQKLL